MKDKGTEGPASGRVPILRHELAGGSAQLGADAEEWIARQHIPMLRALLSSVCDRFDVPLDSGAAMAMLVSGLAEHLSGKNVRFPERQEGIRYEQVVWFDLKRVLTAHGHALPPAVQDMFMWTFMPHTRCAPLGKHAPSTRFAHVWDSLFPSSECVRLLCKILECEIERGDDCRDALWLLPSTKNCLASIARTIRSRNEHLYSFLDTEHARRSCAG